MRQFDAYRKTTVDTSDNVRLVSLLFDGAVNFLKVARGKMEQHDIAGKGIYLGKVTAIVGELNSSLNMEQGGEIARNLRRLYDFVLDRLLKANLKNDLNAAERGGAGAGNAPERMEGNGDEAGRGPRGHHEGFHGRRAWRSRRERRRRRRSSSAFSTWPGGRKPRSRRGTSTRRWRLAGTRQSFCGRSRKLTVPRASPGRTESRPSRHPSSGKSWPSTKRPRAVLKAGMRDVSDKLSKINTFKVLCQGAVDGARARDVRIESLKFPVLPRSKPPPVVSNGLARLLHKQGCRVLLTDGEVSFSGGIRGNHSPCESSAGVLRLERRPEQTVSRQRLYPVGDRLPGRGPEGTGARREAGRPEDAARTGRNTIGWWSAYPRISSGFPFIPWNSRMRSKRRGGRRASFPA